MFGPQSPQTASHVQSICDTMEVLFNLVFALLPIHSRSIRKKRELVSILIHLMSVTTDSASGNTLGLPAEKGELSRQLVSASKRFIKGNFFCVTLDI